MSPLNRVQLSVYRRNRMGKAIPLSAALAWAVEMKKRKPGGKGYVKPKSNHVPKMISGPPETIRKGAARASFLGRTFSEHVMRLIEEDYAKDDRVVMTMTVARDDTEEYQRFRDENPPIVLPPEIRRSESETERD